MYFTLTRPRIVALFFSGLLILSVIGDFSLARNQPKNAETNAKRLDFLVSLGCVPQETARSERELILPADAGCLGEDYLALQREAGYRMTDYLGCRVHEYIYPITFGENSETYFARLLVYHGRVIGGDFSPERFGGMRLPLTGKAGKESENGTTTVG